MNADGVVEHHVDRSRDGLVRAHLTDELLQEAREVEDLIHRRVGPHA